MYYPWQFLHAFSFPFCDLNFINLNDCQRNYFLNVSTAHVLVVKISKFIVKRFQFVVAILICFVTQTTAAPLITPLDHVMWKQSGDLFYCQLSTKVTNFGQVNLIKKAGYPIKLTLDSVIYVAPLKDYRVGASDAPWSLKELPPAQWFHQAQSAKPGLTEQVLTLLQQLKLGRWGHLSLNYTEQQLHLVLPAIQPATAFNQFFSCLTTLAPLSYDQVRDRNFYFDPYAVLLSSGQRQKLANIIKFIELEPRVKKILIDGYADQSGNNIENLRLSQQRADDLFAYLLEAGIPDSKIQVRSHGSRYSGNQVLLKNHPHDRRVNLRIVL